MPILGGSPLGIIGVESRPKNGMSTFNGGRTRNVNVNLYNAGREANKEKLAKAGLDTKSGAFSLFTGNNAFKAWPNIGKTGNEERLNVGIGEPYNGVTRRTLHNNDVYDTSILNLVDKTANSAARLRPSDFAYLKNVGLYPNNRLMIARRFSGPAPDDIFGFKGNPIACLITWKPPGEDFLDISFGEEWEDAKADFTQVLNNIGEDLMRVSPLGGAAGGGLGVIPLPGWSEALTQELLVALGVLDPSVTNQRLQVGNPNLIKQAKRRKTIPYGEAGSGLTCTVSIKMICEYEQKFISGIDPTIAYMDILSNIARFGTSPHVDYGLSKSFAAKMIQWVKNPKQLVRDVVAALGTAIKKAVAIVEQALNKIIEDTPEEPPDDGIPDEEDDGPTPKEMATAMKDKAMKFLGKIVSKIGNALAKTVQKYEEEVKGIANALTLSPSTPWHITIGNPLRPVFSSGDMYTTSVQLILGPNLAFNDLPSSVKVEFTLNNARAWGLTEILGKFNSGHLRVVNVVADSSSLNPNQSLLQGAYYYSGGASGPSGSEAGSSTTTPGAGTETISGSPSTTKENASQATVNSDPNSSNPPVQGEQVKSSTQTSNSTAADQVAQQAASSGDAATDASATSKRGYTYTVTTRGEKDYKRGRAVDKEGNEVFNKKYPIDTPDSQIIEDAKSSLNDK